MSHVAPWKPRAVALMAVALLTACNGSGNGPAADTDAGDAPTNTTAGEPGEFGPGESILDTAVCLRGRGFVADGAVPLDPTSTGDAEGIGRLRWERHDGCERLVVDLVGADGDPAVAAGDVRAEVLRRLGVVRVTLKGVESVDPGATDDRFAGPLARAAYAVWAPEGRWTYVDVHLADPAEARVLLLTEPARMVVDLRPGGNPLPPPPATGERVVVLEPRSGRASYPLTVTGYARTFEANVVARLERSGEVVHENFTTATAWVDAWGHYSMTIPDGPAGSVRLHVGEHSARDGTWEGVAVELEMR